MAHSPDFAIGIPPIKILSSKLGENKLTWIKALGRE
jgi:hypothetical protein